MINQTNFKFMEKIHRAGRFPGIPLNFDIMITYIIESPNGETHKLEVFRTATGFSVYVDGSNICESITEEDFLQELENPTF